MPRERRPGGGGVVPLVLVGLVGLVIGVMLGGLQPRSELRELRAQVRDAEACTSKGSPVGAEVVRALGQRSLNTPPPRRPLPGELPPEPAPEPVSDGVVTPGDRPHREEGVQRSPEQDLGVARDAMRMRQRQALAALEEQARPGGAQWEAIHDAIEDMNGALLDVAEDFATRLAQGEPDRREMMVLGADLLDILIDADNRLYDALDEGQRAGIDPDLLDPLSYLDAEIIDAFARLDGP